MVQKSLDEKLIFDEKARDLVQQKLRQIDAFNFDWKKKLIVKDERELQELKEIATIASVGSSTRIEGVVLTDSEIAELVQNLEINKLKTRDQEEVTGYHEAINIVFSEYKALGLTESNIKQLHNILLKYSKKDQDHKGKYKAVDNKVVAKYPDGSSRVIFQTTEPFLVEKEMSELVEWTNNKLTDSNFHPIIVIAIFTYEFLSIHPFQDGNGRLSRLLSNLLLIRNDYNFIEYKSFEHVIEERKKDYYRVLMDGQKDRGTKDEDLYLWLIFFLDSLITVCERLKSRPREEYQIDTNNQLNDRQETILAFIHKNKKTRIAAISKAFPEIPRSTLSTDLAYLVEQEFISKHGQSRGTYYHAN